MFLTRWLSGASFGVRNAAFFPPARLPSLGAAGVLLMMFLGGTAHAQPLSFEGAKWIWYSQEPMPMSQSFPGGVNYFRGTFALPTNTPVQSAELVIAADNLFTLYVNGRLAGESEPDPNLWSHAKRFNVASLLVPGRNVVGVEGINTVPSPAGLVVKLVVQLADGSQSILVSDEPWKSLDKEVPNWSQPAFDDKAWRAAHVVGAFGIPPWGRIGVPSASELAGPAMTEARRKVRQEMEAFKASTRRGGLAMPQRVEEIMPPADYVWPEAVVFVGEDCSLYRPSAHTGSSMDSLSVTIFNPHHSRAFPEHDLPAPVKVGGKLFVLEPARPGVTPRVLVDAGKGGLGSPTVSFDGQWIYLSMARDGESFFHIYKVPAVGGEAKRLTDGPFHDIDPCELPDGRIVFTSTRIGTFEEYHNPPSRSLFTMSADGRDIRPLTYTFIFDNEPEVLADGRILFIRSDNFFDRGKVETLLHAVHPDGTEGYTEFGLDLGPDYGSRLRAYNVGSPAPMADGRVAFITGSSIAVGRPGCMAKELQQIRVEAGDVSALPDGRLLCTVPRRIPVEKVVKKQKRNSYDYSFEKLGLVDPSGKADEVVILFDAQGEAIHSPVFLGARPRPPVLAQKVEARKADDTRATGVLFCQNARFTKNGTAGWSNVRAVRVLAGQGLNVRSSHSYIVHAGSDVTELGTVPLAPDGSFAVEVPADTAIAFQAVDAEGRSELNEMSWIYVRPGESRGCVGCHQPRQVTPPSATAEMQAMHSRPVKLLGQGQPHRFRGNNAAVTGQMELQFDRYREVAGINRHSETAKPLATGAEEVAALIAQLKGDDANLKISAAQRLAIFRNLAAAPALAECLREPSREVRLAAAMALAPCGTRESVPPLLAALTDAEPLVAQAAAVALENLTGHAQPFDAFAGRAGVPPALGSGADVPSAFGASRPRTPSLTDETSVPAGATPAPLAQPAQGWREWFKATDWEKIEQALTAQLSSTNRDVVRRAAVALGHVGGAAARVALREYVARERDNNPFPEWRKTHQGDGARFNSLSPANPRTLQAATRALGYLRDAESVPVLAETLLRHSNPANGNLFLAEAAAEALGRIATSEAETALTNAFARLPDYLHHTEWYGDHGALIACHASPVHYFITEALDAMGSTRASGIVPHLIRSVPTDPDRALLPESDDCETLTGRVIRRGGAEAAVVETCLAILGDTQAARGKDIETAIGTTHQAWGGKPDPENRAAQILSLTCRDRKYEPRLRAAFDRYRAKTNDIPRLFDTGIPVVTKLPVKNWVCFFLARTLGNLADGQSADSLLAALDGPTEAALGRPDPLGPGVLFIHNDLTPCWRAAAAWALGRIGDKRAVPTLLKVVGNLDNAPDTRHAAAVALGRMADGADLAALRKLAQDYPDISTRRALLQACAKVTGLASSNPSN